MSIKPGKHPVVTRWVCGRRWGDSYEVAEIQFYETPKQLVVVDGGDGKNKRALENMIGYGTNFHKHHDAFHLTREAAIKHRLETLLAQVARLDREMADLRAQIEEVNAL